MTTEREMTTERDPWYPGGQRDAMVWADEFERIFPGAMDRGTMLGWFANAIETGVMVGRREVKANLGGSDDA